MVARSEKQAADEGDLLEKVTLDGHTFTTAFICWDDLLRAVTFSDKERDTVGRLPSVTHTAFARG